MRPGRPFGLRVLGIAGLLLSHCAAGQRPPDDGQARNVILFLSDGTGLATVHAASVHSKGAPQSFSIHSMPHLGLMETSAANTWITDSAAGMTAIVTGHKTHVGVVSQGPDAQPGKLDGTPLKTILEYAEERGLATGVVSNSPITDATPAACYAHANSRVKWGEIFAQIVQPRFGDGVDVVIGAGRDAILALSAKVGFDAAPALEAAGYCFLDDPADLATEAGTHLRLVSLFRPELADFPLAVAVDTALGALTQSRSGFFLMVESNNHHKDIEKTLSMMASFDEIVRSTRERFRGTDTLILFTADHSYDIQLPHQVAKGADIVPAMTVQGEHTAEEVLVLAEGPGAERVRGFLSNTDLFHIMMAALGWEEDEVPGSSFPENPAPDTSTKAPK